MTFGSIVGDPVFLSRLSNNNLSFAELFFLSADLKQALPFDHIVDFVRALVRMSGLRLAGLETVKITKKSFSLKNPVLFHFLRRELHGIRNLFKALHVFLPDQSLSSLGILTHVH